MSSSAPQPGSEYPSLQPPPFPTVLAQPQNGSGAPISAPAFVPPAVPALTRRGRSAPMWLFLPLGVVLFGLASYFLTNLGPMASILGAILALFPLAGVLFAVHLIDRWEPEPMSLKILALAWGAIVAVAFALIVDLGLSNSGLLMYMGAAETAFSSVVQAPIVEEVGKGLGVLLIFAVARRAFDGPVDGVVYGALVGAGFAFTENIQYFVISFYDGGQQSLTVTFFARGILSPFAHVMFTAVTGFALGLAARRGLSIRAALGPFIAGLIAAAALHALWNWSATFGDFLPLYVTLQIPLFLLFILAILGLRREESRLTRSRLGEYVQYGFFTPQEVDMLATGKGRRAAMAWAGTLRGDRRALMRSFISDSASLAAARQRAFTGRDPRAIDDERILLSRVTRTRSALFSP